MNWIEESERSCQEHLARYHHLRDAWQGNPRIVFQLNKINDTFPEFMSCVEGTAAQKTGLAAAKARRTAVKSIVGREMRVRKV